MIEYGLGIPTKDLICEQLGKTIMRSTMMDKLPTETVFGEKIGFGSGIGYGFGYGCGSGFGYGSGFGEIDE